MVYISVSTPSEDQDGEFNIFVVEFSFFIQTKLSVLFQSRTINIFAGIKLLDAISSFP